MPSGEGKNLGEGIRLILEEIRDLRREQARDHEESGQDRKQAESDRVAFLKYIQQVREADRLDRQALKATLDTLVRQHAKLAEILERQGAKLGTTGDRMDRHTDILEEIRDILRRGGNGMRPPDGNGHGKP